MPDVEVWRAVALSLNIDPETVRINQHSWMAATLIFQESSEFKDRVFVAGRNLGHSLTVKREVLGEPEKCSVIVSEFAAWAVSIGWKVPEELLALATQKAKGGEQNENILAGKSRTSALKLILGMAMGGYGYNPNGGRSTTVKEILDDMQRHGISLTDDTIRDWLKEAAQEIDWQRID